MKIIINYFKIILIIIFNIKINFLLSKFQFQNKILKIIIKI